MRQKGTFPRSSWAEERSARDRDVAGPCVQGQGDLTLPKG